MVCTPQHVGAWLHEGWGVAARGMAVLTQCLHLWELQVHETADPPAPHLSKRIDRQHPRLTLTMSLYLSLSTW